MRLERLTAVLVSLVLMVTAGCNAGQSLTNLGGLLPRAAIPNVPDEQATDDSATQAIDPTQQSTPEQPTQAQNDLPPPQTPSTPAAADAQPPVSTTPPQQAAAPTSQAAGTISFTPVIGAPVSAVQPLSRRLGSAARSRGLTILQSASVDSDHILKGYFSAFTDGDKTTVAFVWDVLDGQGNRLHRIRGQEVAQGTAGDPWEVVKDSTMETIATTTIDEYVSWRSQSGS